MSKKLKSCTLLVRQKEARISVPVPSVQAAQVELLPEISPDQDLRFRRIAQALARLGQMSEDLNPKSGRH